MGRIDKGRKAKIGKAGKRKIVNCRWEIARTRVTRVAAGLWPAEQGILPDGEKARDGSGKQKNSIAYFRAAGRRPLRQARTPAATSELYRANARAEFRT